ncbi:MAG TPA: SGNH/GDSL hydrolase family protein [Polyangia bacterium]|nr:SGNH/GDSL hydrolase family protein [Polyangia bacterium]
MRVARGDQKDDNSMTHRQGTIQMVLAAAALVGCSSGGGDKTGTGGSAGDAGPDGGGRVPPAGVVASGVRWFGRVDTTNATGPRFSWSGTGFVAQLSGTGLSADLTMTTSNEPWLFRAVVDGTAQPVFTATNGAGTYTLATGLASGTHTVSLYRQTEGGEGEAVLTGLTAEGGTLADPPPGPARLIEFIGDSITCGYGTLGALADTDCFPTESAWDSYAGVTGQMLGAEVSNICASGRGVVQNYDGSTGGTLPMLYGRTITNAPTPAWDFHIEPDAVVINLGTNDIAKSDPGTAFTQTYQTLLQTVRSHYPHAYIFCIIGPLLSGSQLTTIQGYISTAVAAQNAAGDARVEYFDQIQPQPSSAAACQYHPNMAEQTTMATQLSAEIASKLGW